MDLLKVENVTKRYADHTALDDVSLSVPAGSIYGLLGPNGAGKTTLIRIINRITAPDRGRVVFDGHEITPEDVDRIGYLPEERGLYKKMRVGEQAIYFARLKGLSRQEATRRLKVWFEHFDIRQWWDKKVEELSKGMAQKVQFIITVLHEPRLLILDEPFSGFDPINANIIKQEILRLRESGSTVIFSTHNMSSVEEICDHISLINRSRNILSGEVNDIRRMHGSNIFDVEFIGEESTAVDAVRGLAQVLAGAEDVAMHRAVKIHIPEAANIRQVISSLNSAVELRTFREIIPGMNDIFIKAVSGRNQSGTWEK